MEAIKYIESFDEKFGLINIARSGRAHTCEAWNGLGDEFEGMARVDSDDMSKMKHHLINTVISVLQEQIDEISIINRESQEYNHKFPGRDEYYYNMCTTDVIVKLTKTLSDWKALIN